MSGGNGENEGMEWVEQVEILLEEYPKLQAKIKRLSGTIRRFTRKLALEEYSLDVQDYSKISSGKTNVVISRHEEWVVHHLDRYPDLMELIVRRDDLLEEKGAIDAALDALTSEQRRLVDLRYFQQYKMVDVCSLMDIGSTKAYETRKDALEVIYYTLV